MGYHTKNYEMQYIKYGFRYIAYILIHNTLVTECHGKNLQPIKNL